MEIIATIAALLKITDIVLNIRDKLDKRENVSQYLHSIGILVESISVDLINDTYPHNKCSQMNYHLNCLEATISKHLKKEDYDLLKEQLNLAYNVERMFGEYRQLDENKKQKNLNTLQIVSGTFIAMAEAIKL